MTQKLGVDVRRSTLVLSTHAWFTHSATCLDCDREIALTASEASARAAAKAHRCDGAKAPAASMTLMRR